MKLNNIQIWVDVLGYQGLYKISNCGRIKNQKSNKILKPYVMQIQCKNKKYLIHRIRLSKNNKLKAFLVHRLVWVAFNGVIPQGYQIDHIDNNPQNNRLQNLQLLTASENNKKRFADNKNLGKQINKSKRKKIKCINNNIIYESISTAAEKLNLYSQNISKVLHGKYKHTGSYQFQWV